MSGAADDTADDAVRAAVYGCWQSIVARDGFDPDQPLARAGADSLRLMRFTIELEARLGRAVPYDLLSPETTARQLVGILRQAGADVAADTRPTAFMLGGVGGDESMLGELRRGLSHLFAFTQLDAPGDQHPEAVLTDLAATAGVMAAEIARLQPTGAVRLVGYSYGGLLAFEATRHLAGHGREVTLLCLLDAAPVRGPLRRAWALLAEPGALPRRLRALVPRWNAGDDRPSLAVEIAYRLGAYRTAARLARGTTAPHDPAQPSAQLWLSDRLDVWSLRVRAARRWRPTPLHFPGTAMLFVSSDGLRKQTPRFWRRLLGGLAVIEVPVSHGQLASPAALAVIAAALAPVAQA